MTTCVTCGDDEGSGFHRTVEDCEALFCTDPGDHHSFRASELDVERLAAALAAIDARIVAEHPEEAVVFASSETVKGRSAYARALAAEYARLREAS